MRELAKTIFHAGEAARLGSSAPVFSISDKFEGFWTPRKYSRCLASPLHAVVTATGELSVCQDVFIRFGNINEQLLAEIWGSPAHKAAIAKIAIEDCPRCVMNTANEVMENVFLKDKIKGDML